jgi:HEAT repeat protein
MHHLLCEILVAGALLGQADDDHAKRCARLLAALDEARPKEMIALVHKIGALGRHGKEAVPALENLLHSENDDLANQAARSLAQIGAASVPALVAASRDDNQETSLRGLWALCTIGPDARHAAAELLPLLDRAQERIRAGALAALGELRPEPSLVAAAIIKSIRTPSPMIRYQAVLALAKIGTNAVPDLARLLDDDDPDIRADAARTLSLYAASGKHAIPALEAALKDREDPVRASAAYTLGAMGQAAQASLPLLIDRLTDSDYDVQVNAFQAATAIGLGDPRLMDALREANLRGKWATPFVLQQFGKNPADIVTALTKTLQAADPAHRLGAAWALGQMGLPAKDAIAPLQKALQDQNPQVRVAAWMALSQIRNDAIERTHPLLQEWRRSVDQQLEFLRKNQLTMADLRRLRFEQLMNNPHVQRHYDSLVQVHISQSLMRDKYMAKDLDKIFAQAGPEAIPSLVKAINLVASLNIGFT